MSSKEMLQAIWNGEVLAESDDIVTVEGNAYFPASSIDQTHFEPSSHHSICPWKGRAHYLTVVADGEATRMPPGITPTRYRRHGKSRVASPSGRA